MTNNLPDKYRENFIYKLKRAFQKLFDKKNRVIEVKKEEVVKNEKTQTDVFEQMRHESKKVKLENDILAIIDNNPELINTLSFERLEVVSKMYDKIIEDNNRKINKLKRSLP